MKKAVIGMSGGVDSAVAASVLKEQGIDVIGVNLKFFDSDSDNQDDARAVCEKLGIPFHTMDFREQFREKVMEYFAREYFLGRTPNPCVVCNRFVKWESLFIKMKELGADYVATGHYANVIYDESRDRYTLKRAKTEKKDQTYALSNLSQEQLKHTLMPLGEFEKEDVRKLAESLGLSVATKKDSQEICFIPDNDYGKFLENFSKKEIEEGNFKDESGNILGRHKGIIYYTTGQRKGLGIAFGKPMFVKKIDAKSNDIILAGNDSLLVRSFTADNINYMLSENPEAEKNTLAKIRYSHKAAPCQIKFKNKTTIECEFEEPQRAITPGQRAVFYSNDSIICGADIKESF